MSRWRVPVSDVGTHTALVIEAAATPMASHRKVEIQGLSEEATLRLAETFIVPFLRTTGGDVTIRWGDGRV